jgi:hypothetical protein
VIAQIHMYTCIHELADGIGSASWSEILWVNLHGKSVRRFCGHIGKWPFVVLRGLRKGSVLSGLPKSTCTIPIDQSGPSTKSSLVLFDARMRDSRMGKENIYGERGGVNIPS